ncbi:ABC-F family ATP-binding cassette domain-containing protein [Salinibacillus xinjiangensis]|uniref:ATP-binding cassette domain-containing protein n=1 Tax=Salinibacillus xinjiangensis TaxID=1229268 RepID=A0A6G1X8W4_9BACI|nr:ABC-F family ATP-binding cassette domain-containing protein [Salinibacillus xinjiangensis]MRG87345.1 ATP-binding cassette domain-containing protein [Salinibacillus xinjiangensis]
MILMQVNHIEKYFGADLILSNIKLEVHSQDRIAIVGRNGAGKSTLLKIMAGDMSYDGGEILQPRDTTLGYLAQNTGLESSLTIWEEMESVFSHLKKMEKTIREIELKMGDPDLIQDETAYQQLLADYDQKQEEFKRMGGFEYEADIKSILTGLKFHNVNTPINTLSGGQKTRLALGKLLLSKPDILILDEPTNHLDIGTLDWLEQYLQGYQGAVVIVSHDRYFLDKTVNVVYEISFQTSKKYNGNYSDYLVQKAEDYEQNVKQYEKQQSEVKKLEEFIQKNIVRASTTKRAQSRRKKLEKMELMDKPMLENQSAKFSFDINRQSGNDVLKINDVSFRYPSTDDDIFQHVNLMIHRGDRIGLVGPNGIGKSTLLKTIIGSLKPSHGSIQHGTNVQIGYYDQEQTNLSNDKTVLHELWDEYPSKPEKEIRTVLGNFLFSGDDVLKPVPSLSGGEKARLVLAKLMLQKANFLIMDEPTNHLDLDSKEVLESALADFPGTILFVSHDRYFINRIATTIVEMSKTGTQVYLGDYDYYLSKKQEEKEIQELNALENKPQEVQEDKHQFFQDKAQKRELRKIQRRIDELEKQIQEIEEKMEANEQDMIKPEFLNDHEKLQELTKENEHLSSQLEEFLEEWTELQEELTTD